MARSGSSFESRLSTGVLDRQIDASLRRQFSVPPAFLKPGEGFVPMSPVGGVSGGGWNWVPRFDVLSGSPLRKAAGILLAATLWSAAGLVVYATYGPSGAPQRSSGLALLPKLDPNAPVGMLAQEHWSQQLRTRRMEAREPQAGKPELWEQLTSVLEDRGLASARLERLRDEQSVELLAINEWSYNDRTLLMVSASFEGEVETTLFETTAGQSSVVGVPSAASDLVAASAAPTGALATLYRGENALGFVYSITRSEPRLPTALFAVNEMEMVQEVSRGSFARRPVALAPETQMSAPAQ